MPKKEKVMHRDNQASFTTNRVNFLQSKEKKKDSVENQDQNYESNKNDDSNEMIAPKEIIESLETDAQVGAFAVPGIPGIPGGTMDVDEPEYPDSRLSMTQRSQDAASVNIIRARVVDDVIIKATPLEGVPKKGLIIRYTLIAIVSLLLLIVITVPTIVLTRQSPSNNSPILDAAANDFLQKLKPLLSTTSREELDFPESVPSLALSWLLLTSNFSAYPFDRQVQRFVMAEIYYSTEGVSWNKSQDWLSDEDECSWYQSYNGSRNACLNGTLLALSLEKNDLKGLLPNDIALLNSLTLLNLHSNSLAGSIPSEIGALTKLTRLNLYSNSLAGSIPSEIGALTKLTRLDLSYNSLRGSLPSEIGALTKLTGLDLSYNSLRGSIPSEIGALTKLTYLDLYPNPLTGYSNSLTGSIPNEIAKLTKLTRLDLSSNSLDGFVPSEIAKLTKLEWLDLSSNSLYGSIPSEIAKLTKLTRLDLSDNMLHGSIPELLCNQGLNPLVDEHVVSCDVLSTR